jgi:hypothetical protein
MRILLHVRLKALKHTYPESFPMIICTFLPCSSSDAYNDFQQKYNLFVSPEWCGPWAANSCTADGKRCQGSGSGRFPTKVAPSKERKSTSARELFVTSSSKSRHRQSRSPTWSVRSCPAHHAMTIMPFNRNATYLSHIKELSRQIQVLQMENDAKDQEVDNFRRRLHLSKKENQRLREALMRFGQEMVLEGCSKSVQVADDNYWFRFIYFINCFLTMPGQRLPKFGHDHLRHGVFLSLYTGCIVYLVVESPLLLYIFVETNKTTACVKPCSDQKAWVSYCHLYPLLPNSFSVLGRKHPRSP